MLIWHSPHHNLTELADCIASAVEDTVILTDLSTAETTLREPGAAPLVVLTDAPQILISAKLQQGISPAAALQEWSIEAEAILGLFRRHRRDIRIIEATAAQAHSDRLPQLLKLSGGLPDVPEVASKVDPMLLVLAEYSLRIHPGLEQTSRELAACIPDLANGTLLPHVDPDAAFVSYQIEAEKHADSQHRITTEFDALKTAYSHNLEEFAALQAWRKTTTNEAEKHKERIAELQTSETQLTAQRDVAQAQIAELEQKLSKAEETHVAFQVQTQLTLAATEELERRQQRIGQLNAGLDSYQAKTAELTSQLTRRDTQVTDLTSQLTRRDTQVTDLTAQLGAGDTARMELEQSLSELHHELHRIMNSHSIRITAPLRGAGDLLRRVKQVLRGDRS